MKSRRMPVTDAMFLYGETREIMLHVASLTPFTPPADAPPDHLRKLVDQMRANRAVVSPWNLKLLHPDFLAHPLQAWLEQDEVDVDYHVRRSALPTPGDERELGVLVSRLHSNRIDFHHAPWEMHLIEGLENGRFAFYIKVHHALIDGYTGVRLMARSLSTDPDDRDTPGFLTRGTPPREPPSGEAGAALDLPGLLKVVRQQLGASQQVGKALLGLLQASRREHDDLVMPMRAPRSILNGPISRNRRFATQTLELARVKAVGKKAGATTNDVVLALCGATLRRYLMDLNALPDEPLIAMVPVNIRPKGDPGGGNSVAAVLASLATHLTDPAERLRAVVASTSRAKQMLEGMSQQALLGYSALLLAPAALQMLKLTAGVVRPDFNVVVSNVVGPDKPLYFRSSRLEAYYPVSIPTHGLALNITFTSYAGSLDFGFVGCRDTLPHMQRLGLYCRDALHELEAAFA